MERVPPKRKKLTQYTKKELIESVKEYIDEINEQYLRIIELEKENELYRKHIQELSAKDENKCYARAKHYLIESDSDEDFENMF